MGSKCLLKLFNSLGLFVLVFVYWKFSHMIHVPKQLLNWDVSEVPTIYVVTPTHDRLTQMPDLIRLAQTLLLVKNVHWIVVEDSNRTTRLVSNLLRTKGLEFTHLSIRTPVDKRDAISGKGVTQRNFALEHFRKKELRKGVVYFADDDNTYDEQIFEEMRWTKMVSVWPVGFVGDFSISSPVVKNGRVVGFHDSYKNSRMFNIDMAGYAVSAALVVNKTDAYFPYVLGNLENYFLGQLGVTLGVLEPRANNCTQILVWHTKTMDPNPISDTNLETREFRDSNMLALYNSLRL